MTSSNILEDLLLFEMSRRNADLVVDLITQKPELFEELFSIFTKNAEPASRRAAWVMDLVTEKHPDLIMPYLNKLVDLLDTFRHDGLKRHSIRILSRSPFPSDTHLGLLISICFKWLLSPDEAVAVKMFCMEMLYRVSRIEPDLKKELADSIELRIAEGSPGFKNRGNKVLVKLHSEIENGIIP